MFLMLLCELFAKNMKLPKEPGEIHSEGHFWSSVAANEGVMTEIATENASDFESLSTEFQFIGRRVAEFPSQHPHVEVIRLKLAIVDLQRQMLRRVRGVCASAKENW
jgi:hypothetical protein